MSRVDYEKERVSGNPMIKKLDLDWYLKDKYKAYIWPGKFENQITGKTTIFTEEEFWVWSKDYLIGKNKLNPKGLVTIDDYYKRLKGLK